ncbi:MAG TPA: 4Fe-4S binding protein, partial [Mobilitalea sp.]|nr:4Fe-4S binding protein [Mobilitalea sp.]
MKRQQLRYLCIFISLLLFPIFMNYLSPYLIVNGAFKGILAGSGIVFLVLLLISMFTGRLFCGWLCPMGGLNDCLTQVNRKRITSKAAKRSKFIIWTIWLGAIISGFVFAGGLLKINMFYMTESGVSVDHPLKYFTYYTVIL